MKKGHSDSYMENWNSQSDWYYLDLFCPAGASWDLFDSYVTNLVPLWGISDNTL